MEGIFGRIGKGIAVGLLSLIPAVSGCEAVLWAAKEIKEEKRHEEQKKWHEEEVNERRLDRIMNQPGAYFDFRFGVWKDIDRNGRPSVDEIVENQVLLKEDKIMMFGRVNNLEGREFKTELLDSKGRIINKYTYGIKIDKFDYRGEVRWKDLPSIDYTAKFYIDGALCREVTAKIK